MIPPETMRLDKWLWSARFFKTRGIAAEEIGKGRVQVNGQAAKASRDVRPGDTIALRQGVVPRQVVVRGLNMMRGPAAAAQQLYEETPESVARRESAAEMRRLAPEPASALTQGRPTKRDRREIDRTTADHGWNDRWSASIDD
ncbi:MAG: S4 domain-containing protein [Xylophilus ampelinus]